ncbi:MAG: flagellar basal body P-ring formation protein FlgA [Acidobacteria bacterium]|nr:flagellar basal body P-ring formation protein FlgA [Acidobacteriota bacterium]
MRLLLVFAALLSSSSPAVAQAIDDVRLGEAVVAAVRARMGADVDVRIESMTPALLRDSGAVTAVPDPGALLGRPIRFALTTTEPGANGPRVVPAGSLVAVLAVSAAHLHTVRGVRPGDTLAAADVDARTHVITGVPLKPLPQHTAAADARVIRTLAADACLVAGAIAPTTAVRTGQQVTAISRFAGGEVTATLVASEAGDPGRVIRVVNPQSRRALRARVVSPGVVEILP